MSLSLVAGHCHFVYYCYVSLVTATLYIIVTCRWSLSLCILLSLALWPVLSICLAEHSLHNNNLRCTDKGSADYRRRSIGWYRFLFFFSFLLFRRVVAPTTIHWKSNMHYLCLRMVMSVFVCEIILLIKMATDKSKVGNISKFTMLIMT